MNLIKKYIPWFNFEMFFKYAGGDFVFQITTIIAEIYVLKIGSMISLQVSLIL